MLTFDTGPSPGGRGWDQQGNNFAGAPAVPGQGYAQAPANAGGYGRGQNHPGGNWNQGGNANFGNGFGAGGYQA
jgi:nucleolysin TIA-1/TIAR